MRFILEFIFSLLAALSLPAILFLGILLQHYFSVDVALGAMAGLFFGWFIIVYQVLQAFKNASRPH